MTAVQTKPPKGKASNGKAAFKAPPPLRQAEGKLPDAPSWQDRIASLERAAQASVGVPSILDELDAFDRLNQPGTHGLTDADNDRLSAIEDDLFRRLARTPAGRLDVLSQKLNAVAARTSKHENSFGPEVQEALESVVDELRKGVGREPSDDIDLLRLAGTICNDYDQMWKLEEPYFDSGEKPPAEIQQRLDAYRDQRPDSIGLMARTPASTMPGLIAKARVVALMINPGGEELGKPRPDSDEYLSYSLCEDLLSQARSAPASACRVAPLLDLVRQSIAENDAASRQNNEACSLAPAHRAAWDVIFRRIDGIHEVMAATQATSITGALLQLLAVAHIADDMGSNEDLDLEAASKKIMRLMFSALDVLLQLPAADIPREVVESYMGLHRNPFEAILSLRPAECGR